MTIEEADNACETAYAARDFVAYAAARKARAAAYADDKVGAKVIVDAYYAGRIAANARTNRAIAALEAVV